MDFVLCSIGDVAPLAVIELDDKSHAASKRQKRDAFLDGALDAAGIPCFHVPAVSAYSVHELRRVLGGVLGDREVALAAVSTSDAILSAIPLEPPTGLNDPQFGRGSRAAVSPVSVDEASHGTCPKCGSELIERVVKRGTRKGSTFVACTSFPECRYTASV